MVYEFGPFSLDSIKRQLTREGQSIQLSSRLLDILLLLVKNSGRVITKEELMKEIWEDSVVEESNITVSISALRKALGETYSSHTYIETVSKRGYRFTGRVRETQSGNENLVIRHWGFDHDRWDTGSQERRVSSLAVLPLVNTLVDSDLDRLCDGLTESLINRLSQSPTLRVKAKSTLLQYKDLWPAPLRAGLAMGVKAILVGRILPAGDELQLSVELINVSDGSLIWSEAFRLPPSNTTKMQEGVAVEIADKLLVKLADEQIRRFTRLYSKDAESYHYYIKGRFFLNKRSVATTKKAIEYFERAAERDPTYALAYSGLADAYLYLSNISLSPKEAMSRARAFAIKAVEIDDDLAEAHMTLGYIKTFYEWDWAGAEKELLRAISLSPYNALAHQRYSLLLNRTGRFRESLEEAYLALNLDPLSQIITVNIGSILFSMDRFTEAIEQFNKALEVDPNHATATISRALVNAHIGKIPEALADADRALELETNKYILSRVGYIYSLSGKREKARQLAIHLEEQSRRTYVSPYGIALIYIGLGENDEAINWLERAYQDRDEDLIHIIAGVFVNSLRSDPRVQGLLTRMGAQNIIK